MAQLYVDHFSTVDRSVGRVLQGADRETIVHEVFCRLLADANLRASFRGGSIRAWISTVGRNLALDYRRRRQREQPCGSAEDVHDDAHDAASPETLLEARELIGRFRDERLPEKWRPVFDARFVQQLHQSEAARALGIHRTTLLYQEFRIRQLLRKFLGVAAAALSLALVQPRVRDLGFTPRGALRPLAPSAASAPAFFAYRIEPAARLEARGATIRPTDDLAFAYTNPSGYRRLLVYGVDEHRHVYWYYPAWSDPVADPHAIGVAPGVELRELPEAIRHAIDGRELTIHAVFLDEDTSVRAVEHWIADPRTAGEPLPATLHEERITLSVEH
jgi:RNA polymerase sigma-70 factor (ECF subfamily)